MSTITFQRPFEAGSSTEYGSALNQLNEKIKNIQKNITYLDTYNITTAVTDETNFPAAKSLLIPGSALVINTPQSFYFNNEEYRVGDVVLRIATGEWIHIKTQVGGLYYPSSFTKKTNNDEYEITYAYYAATPTQDNSAYNPDGTVAAPGKNIIFSGIQESEDNKIYGNKCMSQYDNEKGYFFIFNAYFDSKTHVFIEPIIKFYFHERGVLVEEISANFSYTKQEVQENGQNITKVVVVLKDFPKDGGSLVESLFCVVK